MKKEKLKSKDELFLQGVLMEFYLKSIDAKNAIDRIEEYINTVRIEESNRLMFAPETNFHALPEDKKHREIFVHNETIYKAFNARVTHTGSFQCLECEYPVRFAFEKPERLTGVRCSNTGCKYTYTVEWQETNVKMYVWPSDFVLVAKDYEENSEWSHLDHDYHIEWWTDNQYIRYILGAD